MALNRLLSWGLPVQLAPSTLDIIRQHPDRFHVRGLTANRNVHQLADLAREFNTDYVAIGDKAAYADLKAALEGTSIELFAGETGICDLAAASSDIVVAAIVGAAGLKPTLAAIQRGATIILANKECLVCAGDLMAVEVAQNNARLLPADSEHNAIFQVFEDSQTDQVERLILTASGGPFLNRLPSELADVTPAEAIAHPNWDMGAKISVDSATMMNKGLELIEAYHFFPVSFDAIDVVIHPQSIIHSMVEYTRWQCLGTDGKPGYANSYCLLPWLA